MLVISKVIERPEVIRGQLLGYHCTARKEIAGEHAGRFYTIKQCLALGLVRDDGAEPTKEAPKQAAPVVKPVIDERKSVEEKQKAEIPELALKPPMASPANEAPKRGRPKSSWLTGK